MLGRLAVSGGISGQALHAGSGGLHSQVCFGATRASREQTLNTQPSTFSRLLPGSDPASGKCIACVGAPCSTEASKQVGVSGKLVCAPRWGA